MKQKRHRFVATSLGPSLAVGTVMWMGLFVLLNWLVS